MLNRYWFSRMTISLEVLFLIVLVSWFEPASLTAQAIERTGQFGWMVVVAVAACCMFNLMDVFINDLMPAPYRFLTGLRLRHVGLIGMALMLACLGVVVAWVKGYTPLLFAYWLNAALAMLLVVLDAFARYRKPQT